MKNGTYLVGEWTSLSGIPVESFFVLFDSENIDPDEVRYMKENAKNLRLETWDMDVFVSKEKYTNQDIPKANYKYDE